MKIRELHIYGYGKLENVAIRNVKDLTVFFGENEAGKSTIMSFIHSILFGFPTKQQSENRYEPKNNAKYGGKIILDTLKHGRVSIERVKGKAIGDVTVTFSNGSIGSEAELKNILQGIEKTTFQSIFSFDLDGLQGLRKLEEGEIGKYLLSAGLIGTDKLMAVENFLQKEVDRRFKPSGKNPPLNRSIAELKDLSKEMKKAEQHQNVYSDLQDQLKNNMNKKEQLEIKMKNVEKELFLLNEYKRMLPILRELKGTEEALSQLKMIHFPEAGIKRLEQILQHKLPLEAQITSLEQRKAELEILQTETTPDDLFLVHKETIISLLDRASVYEIQEQERNKLKILIQEKDSLIEQKLQDLHIQLDQDELIKLDTSQFVLSRAEELDQMHEQLKSEKAKLDEKLTEAKTRLEQTEDKIAEWEQRLLSEEKRQQLEQYERKENQINHNDFRLEMLQGQIEKLAEKIKKQKTSEEKGQRKVHRIFLSLIVIGLVLSIGAYFKNDVSLGIAAILFFACSFILKSFFKLPSQIEEWKEELNKLSEEKALLENQKMVRNNVNDPLSADLLAQDRELRNRIHELQIRHEEYEEQFNRIIDEFEKWERNAVTFEDQRQEMLRLWRLPSHVKKLSLVSVCNAIRTLKQDIIEREKLKKDWDRLNQAITKFEDDRKNLTQVLNISGIDTRECLFMLKKKLNEENEKLSKWKHVQNELERLQNEHKQLEAKRSYFQKELNALFSQAQCENEEEFRNKAKQWEYRKQLEDKLQSLTTQYNQASTSFIEWYEKVGEDNINDLTLAEKEHEKEEMSRSYTQLLDEISHLKARIEQLEAGGTYHQLSLAYFEKKSIFQEEAKDWAKYALAKNLLTKAVDSYKNQLLPSIMKRAEEYVSFLTDGEYLKIQWVEGKGLMLLRKDDIWFEAGEVSRGTSETIYVGMRLALALHTFTEEPLPILIDDSFVNFDSKRTKKAIELICELSKQHQIIFFTCHEHILSYFDSSSVISMRFENQLLRG
ncbi:ATP-binding protein [Peribacillus tepidiphilus]|uniref:ATP-binding protein n=1 Tax=Peribacillus tepidiphilus TaxID=2652445 RepID=UPI0017841688|nr:AAA family ATPase [Peribacillus tepidiphilus]